MKVRDNQFGLWNSLRLLYLLFCLLLTLAACKERIDNGKRPRGVSWSNEQLQQMAAKGTWEDAGQLFRMGETPTALQILNRLQAQDLSGSKGDEARLMTATILMSQRRFADAIPFINRVAENGGVAPDYARALLVEAIVEGGVTDWLDRAIEIASAELAKRSEAQSLLLAERFSALLVRALVLRPDYLKASAAGKAYLAEWPSSPRSDEIRFLAAEAFDRAGKSADAARLYADIWYDTPASPWSKQSRDRLRLLPRSAGIETRQLTNALRLDFAFRLQRAGLHEEALQELEHIFERASQEELRKRLFLQAVSLLAVRKNKRLPKSKRKVHK